MNNGVMDQGYYLNCTILHTFGNRSVRVSSDKFSTFSRISGIEKTLEIFLEIHRCLEHLKYVSEMIIHFRASEKHFRRIARTSKNVGAVQSTSLKFQK